MFKLSGLVLAFLVCTGCIDAAIRKHDQVSSAIQLGSSKEEVLSILEPIQQTLSRKARKMPDRYLKDGKEYFIYYARSARQPDDLTTDDEFTPYVFVDGKLTGIGWAALGGPRTQGQAPAQINVQQKMEIR
ncbi:MAG: DUF3192 domain-containing protein [Elusimicrobia bacterium]|nr:DUF3192 domain-containing protein [Elusimicrobiota bacterium]